MRHLKVTIIFICLSAFSGFSVHAQTLDSGRVAMVLESLRQSVNSHEFALLEPILHPDFTYLGQDAGMSRMIMRQVIGGFPNELTAVTVLGTSAVSDTWKVAVRLESSGQPDNRNIILSNDYKIIQADIADIQLAGHSQQPGEAASRKVNTLPSVTTVPFELADRIIVVQAEINGVAGNYLVDTGAQATVLNKAHFDPSSLQTFALDHALPKGVGGEIQDVLGIRNLQLNWGAIRLDGLRGLVTDLSHLEKNLGDVPVMGLIGYNVLEQFQLHFDYTAQELTLFALDDTNNPISETDLGEPELVLSFDMMGHIPVLPVRVAGFDMKMGLDSGAAGAMIFTRWQDRLKGKYEFIERTELTGGDTAVQMGDVVRINSMKIENLNYPAMTFRFNDLVLHGDRQVSIDGLLGFEFLQTQPVAINFRSRQLFLWPRKSHNNPNEITTNSGEPT